MLASDGTAIPLYAATAAAAAAGWQAFWDKGSFVDLAARSGKSYFYADAKAAELERRVVLSQYLTRSQSAVGV
jgi:hypothetical protein